MRFKLNEEKWNNTKWMDLISGDGVYVVFVSFSIFDSIWLHLSLYSQNFVFPLNSMQYFIPFSNNSLTVCFSDNSKEGKRNCWNICAAWRKYFRQIDTKNDIHTHFIYVLLIYIRICFIVLITLNRDFLTRCWARLRAHL